MAFWVRGEDTSKRERVYLNLDTAQLVIFDDIGIAAMYAGEEEEFQIHPDDVQKAREFILGPDAELLATTEESE